MLSWQLQPYLVDYKTILWSKVSCSRWPECWKNKNEAYSRWVGEDPNTPILNGTSFRMQGSNWRWRRATMPSPVSLGSQAGVMSSAWRSWRRIACRCLPCPFASQILCGKTGCLWTSETPRHIMHRSVSYLNFIDFLVSIMGPYCPTKRQRSDIFLQID